MRLSKHQNHRNSKYLSWLRKRKCIASGKKADVAHHIRLGTNGGQALKPSDYFCVPLTNEHHTTGLFAIHIVGEETFMRTFHINKIVIFINQLQEYLREEYKVIPYLDGLEDLRAIEFLINEIELRRTDNESQKKIKTKKPKSEFYESAKEAKRTYDKSLRDKLKDEDSFKVKAPKASESEFYQKAKEAKRQMDKELRAKMKGIMPQKKAPKASESEFYQKAKEAKRAMDKQLRARIKEQRQRE